MIKIPKNIVRAFTGEEPIAGLEISDSFVRLVLLEKNDETQKPELRFSAEEPVAEGAIVDGRVKNPQALEKALKNLESKLRLPIINVIVSAPANFIYAKTLNFPYSIAGEKLDEAIDLAISFQLPLPRSELYVSWEIRKIEETYASKNVCVVSNNSAHRWTEDVPMIIPEVNPEHAKLIDIQRKNRKWKKV